MEFITIFLIGFGLSLDTFAVSISNGLILPEIKFFNACKIAISMAIFQAGMPIIGWLIGNSVKQYMMDFDHWVAFGLLFILGAKMILESFKHEEERENRNPLLLSVIISMSIATSIDAMVVGLGLAFFDMNIILICSIIGAITFFMAMLGVLIGKKTGDKFGKKMEILGGIILIGIGIKILIEHIGI